MSKLVGVTGQGSLDALFGAGLFPELYPKLEKAVLNKHYSGEIPWANLLKVNPWAIIIPAVILITLFLFWVEKAKF